MIKFIDITDEKPYKIFANYYQMAEEKYQKFPQAVCISSFNSSLNEVDARFVNLKYMIGDEWIFFSNYKSKKAIDFKTHSQISALFFWNSIEVQIRINAKIKKTAEEISDDHFKNRSKEKNALSISSKQSNKIKTFEEVISNYKKVLTDEKLFQQRPQFWGGYSFKPTSFEFWEGNKNRLNKRVAFKKIGDSWDEYLLEP